MITAKGKISVALLGLLIGHQCVYGATTAADLMGDVPVIEHRTSSLLTQADSQNDFLKTLLMHKGNAPINVNEAAIQECTEIATHLRGSLKQHPSDKPFVNESLLLPFLGAIPIEVDKSLDPAFDFLSKTMPTFNRAVRILEIGCGSGRLSLKILERYSKDQVSQIYTTDLCPHAVKILPETERLTPMIFDATNLADNPFGDTKFDIIISVGAVRYFLDQSKIQDLSGLLTPDGAGAIFDYKPFVGSAIGKSYNVRRLTTFSYLIEAYRINHQNIRSILNLESNIFEALFLVAGTKELSSYQFLLKP